MTDPRLARLLGGGDLAWLVARARQRLERGDALVGEVTRRGASESERRALARLVGRPPGRGAVLVVRLEAVDEVLRRSGVEPAGLEAAVVALTGPVVDRRSVRQAEEQAWARAAAPLDALVEHRPELADWWQAVRTRGLRHCAKDPGRAAVLFSAVARVLAELPAAAQPRARFAERVLGSAHALDRGMPPVPLVFGAARALGGAAQGRGARWERAVWAGVGLLRDDLSSTVLTLGLPGSTSTATGRALGILGEAGEPAVLTLRQLTGDAPALAVAGRVVSVCENPVVVAVAADELGSRTTPLVCVDGQPGAAVLTLLHQLADAGAHLRYHGDFDWGGLRIAGYLFDRLPLQPWRFGVHDYRAASAGRPLEGRPAEASWDTELGPAMVDRGHAVEEEQVLDALVADLAA